MSKFLVCIKQKGSGCDYTIGCGMKYEIITADSEEAFKEKVLFPDGIDNDCSYGGGLLTDEIRISELLYVELKNGDLKSIDCGELFKDLEKKERKLRLDLELAKHKRRLKALETELKSFNND